MGRSGKAVLFRGAHEAQPGATVSESRGCLQDRGAPRRSSGSITGRIEIRAPRREADHRHEQIGTAAASRAAISGAHPSDQPAAWSVASPHAEYSGPILDSKTKLLSDAKTGDAREGMPCFF